MSVCGSKYTSDLVIKFYYSHIQNDLMDALMRVFLDSFMFYKNINRWKYSYVEKVKAA